MAKFQRLAAAKVCVNLRDLRETIYEANARVNLRDLRETISALGHFVIHGRLCTLFKAFGPETVLVQDGKHGILHLPLIRSSGWNHDFSPTFQCRAGCIR